MLTRLSDKLPLEYHAGLKNEADEYKNYYSKYTYVALHSELTQKPELMLQSQCCVESRTHDPRRNSNRVSPLGEVDSTIAATNSTLYVSNHHATPTPTIKINIDIL